MVNKSSNCVRSNLNALLCKILSLFGLFSLARVVFWVYNRNFFADVAAADIFRAYLVGLRVDWCLISLISAPTVVLYLFPIGRCKCVTFFANVWFFTASSIALLLNIFDAKYFQFTFRRLGGEIFSQWELFTESSGIYWSALSLYWHLVLCAIIFVYLTWLISFKIVPSAASKKNVCAKNYLIFTSTIALIVLGIRGGFQNRPFRMAHLPISLGVGKSQFLANNSCLNIIHTSGKAALPDFQFFLDRDELNQKFSPIHPRGNFGRWHGAFAGKNVVVLILESFTAQNIGFLDRKYKVYPERTFTPFLDDLLAKSLHFDGFANGMTSIDGLTAILEGVPALFESPFVTSAFSCNRGNVPLKAMRQMGYATLFFCGGKRNSCNFDSGRAHAGVEKYLSRYDFFRRHPNLIRADVSGTWGVHDEEFLQFVSEILSESKSPFFATIFTLSSHYPFEFPKKYKGHFPAGEHPLQEVTAYTDFALRRFFEAAQHTDWYNNTIFILVADHTACATERYYRTALGGYSIPFAIFDPSGKLHGESDLIAQQIDIMPTILDLVGYDEACFSFGHSLFDENAPRFAVSYKNGTYQIITSKYVLQFEGKSTIGFYLRSDFLLKNNLVQSIEYKQDIECIEALLKAFLQQYSHSLRMNKMTCE
ncbi:MAG: sulfatase-like hydrolase/transferase [Puniceicoccales bacterium]|jgi:phosphoglycerol transferase MdoB-like AlkP superfamily enzyme|nr:sulfatase-like hydrolase/transferase [Puniceicoccales bacterium]